MADSPVGYGYTVTTVTNNPAANSLTANLKLTASFETKDGLRVRITNSLHKRWEIPQDLIPRDSSSLFSSSSLSHSFLFRDPQNPKHILTHPNSDLIFTLHKPIPLINFPPFNYNPSSTFFIFIRRVPIAIINTILHPLTIFFNLRSDKHQRTTTDSVTLSA